MNYQNMPIPAIASMAQHTRLKNSSQFNGFMYRHYRGLFQKYRKRWNMVSATCAWLRMKEYQKRMNDCLLTEMLNPDKDHYHEPFIIK